MLELQSGDHQTHNGYDVFSFNGPLPACCPEDLQGQHVLIDGKPYTVKGVEMFALARSHDNPYPQNLNYGLLVEKWKGRGFGDYWENEKTI